MKIGVLALQGDFALHVKTLKACGRSASRTASGGEASGAMIVDPVEVRKPEQLADLDGLVMPGGESTTLLKLIDEWHFVPALEKFHAAGKPMFGTCAGLILLAREVENPRQFSLGFIDVDVERNSYGRQRESFQVSGTAVLDGAPASIEMMFIRAPRIRRVGEGVEVLARQGDDPVMARQGTVLVATFHPEVTGEQAVHRYFCEMVRRRRETNR
ncbi:MAG TPA: pyridoxal 5'-phosphate synthase glutaminase subunit PdxT [Candidatus Acidoferrum sp.]|nr:pyridoxal 5'-phosphate synthase glutaminase subunit PdxT [Candidatus Acidoferrum sp.]